MNEIYAIEERLSQEKNSADMRRLQERIIAENGYRREKARLEGEIERERHERKMGDLAREMEAEQRVGRERAMRREGGDDGGGGRGAVGEL